MIRKVLVIVTILLFFSCNQKLDNDIEHFAIYHIGNNISIDNLIKDNSCSDQKILIASLESDSYGQSSRVLSFYDRQMINHFDNIKRISVSPYTSEYFDKDDKLLGYIRNYMTEQTFVVSICKKLSANSP